MSVIVRDSVRMRGRRTTSQPAPSPARTSRMLRSGRRRLAFLLLNIGLLLFRCLRTRARRAPDPNRRRCKMGELLAERLTAQLIAGEPAREPVAVAERLLGIQAQDLRGARLAIRARTAGRAARSSSSRSCGSRAT